MRGFAFDRTTAAGRCSSTGATSSTATTSPTRISFDDAAVFERALAGPPIRRLLLGWPELRQLVTTRQMAARPGFEEAARRSAARGWPVAVRGSGGTTVAQHEGILNVSVIRIGCAPPVRIEQPFEELCGLLSSALATMGIGTDTGRVPGSHCDGAYNLRWRGHKLAGTAATIRTRGPMTGWLAHACLGLWGDPAEDLRAIGAFERDLGLSPDYRPAAHVTVSSIGWKTRAATRFGAALQRALPSAP